MGWAVQDLASLLAQCSIFSLLLVQLLLLLGHTLRRVELPQSTDHLQRIRAYMQKSGARSTLAWWLAEGMNADLMADFIGWSWPLRHVSS